MRSRVAVVLLTAAAYVGAARADVVAEESSLSTMSTDVVLELLESWGLTAAFGAAFREHEVSGADLQTYFMRGRVDAETFAPAAHPFQWDKLWDKLENVVKQHEASKTIRRRLATAGSASGLRIRSDNARVSFGPDDATFIERTEDGGLAVNGTIEMMMADGSRSPLVDTESFKEMVGDMVREAVGVRACAYGLTGEYCNETCTDVSYYVMPGCFYHDTPSEELQLESAAAFLGWYHPDLEAATIQCCSDTTCTRKVPGTSTCLAGSRTTSDPFAVFVTYDAAKKKCEDNGLRLCTVDEYLEEGHDCCGSGCSYDHTVVWTSDMQYNCGGRQSY